MTAIQARQELLRRDPDVLRWIKAHRSETTARAQLQQLELFCRRTGKSPADLVRLGRAQRNGKSREFEDVVLKWIDQQRKAGRPDSYISLVFAAVRSWLKHEEAAPDWKPRLKVRFGSTILNEVVPTPEQLRAVLDQTPVPRLRALLLFHATSGARLGVSGHGIYPNGLRLRHLPDLDMDRTPSGPLKVEIPAELSKAGNPYFTFITEEAHAELLTYLRERVARGEKLTPNSALFAPEPKAPNSQKRMADDGTVFLGEKAISGQLKRMLRKVAPKGVRWRPYVLRSFASSQMMMAENAQLMSRDTREFLLGHVADIGRRYNLGKGRIREDLEKQVREQYARASDKFLRILTISPTTEVDVRALYRLALASAGYSDKEIERMPMTQEAVYKAVLARQKATHPVPKPKAGDNARTVLVSELDDYLKQGWKPISAAGSDRFVVGAPN